jgi:ABC-type multidrug transport system fused ATPase/permease subunit
MSPSYPLPAAKLHAVSERGLACEGVRVRDVLRGVALEVRPGEVVALTAPSGAGKSTLLRAIVRLVEVDGGVVRLDGVDVTTLDPRRLRRRVGLVAQRPVMLPGTVADNLAYGLQEPPDLAAALGAAGLDERFAAREAAELSGGEQARVAIARALTRRPQVLLLDEPTAGLDAPRAEAIGRHVRELAAAGLAVCLTSHDRAVVASWADREQRLGAA